VEDLKSATPEGECEGGRHVHREIAAKSPSDSLHQRLQQIRCLHSCSDCYRVERTSSRAGLLPLWTTAFSRRTRLCDLHGLSRLVLVTSRCTAIATFTAPGVPPANLSGVFVSDGNELLLIETDTGTAVTAYRYVAFCLRMGLRATFRLHRFSGFWIQC
jgi:hypothetical protein